MGQSSSSPDTPRTKVVLQGRQLPQIAPRTKVALQSHQFSSSNSPDTPRTKVALQSRQCSPAFRALDTHDLRRGLRGHRTNRTLVYISRTRHARSPRKVAREALSPAFRILDTHDLRRGLRVKSPKRAFRSRLLQKLTRQSLQNERFVRTFLQNSRGNTHRRAHTAPPNNIRL